MATVLVTYHMPEGDNAVVETRGVRFFDGQPVELDVDQNAQLIAKARNNPLFEVTDNADGKGKGKS